MTNLEFYDNEELKEIELKRMKELQKNFETYKVKEITCEKEFMDISKYKTMIVNFYHRDFNKCKIMNYNLEEVAKTFKDIEFYRMDAEKCNYLVEVFKIKELPLLLFFKSGYFIERLTGFEGIGQDTFQPEDLIKKIKRSDIMKDIPPYQEG